MAVTIAIVMSTTIQVSRRTLQLLKILREKLAAKSYDELLQRLAAEKLGLPPSMFGSNPKLTPFTEEDEGEAHEL